jgi:class 3 adenylate cyclase
MSGTRSVGVALAARARDSRAIHRKVVTVLFCDVVGSTALGESVDPEALQGLLARYFERMKTIVESHEGSVEKFIGDAVMAVFGVPQVHEDDALRACRAAVEMRAAFPELGLRGRIGVNSGEVVTGTQERLATGDAVNVAARLQQAAEPNEILIGETTLAFVRGAVETESIGLLELKGKSDPVTAHRLVSVQEPPERSHAGRFVGRDREVGFIQSAWREALTEERCELFTLVGEAGLGKSRLVVESMASIDAHVVRGRCLPYGQGITYWPVVEVMKQLGLPSDPTAAAAVRALVGETGGGTSPEEIAWGFRKLLEEHAPIVVVFDDIQWGEPTFLDLVEGVALLASAPILLVCVARPELLAQRADWPVALRLEPLPAEAAEQLMSDLSPGLRQRVAHAAGGNPLFLTEMLAMAGEAEDVAVPPTLRALLAARLDQLDPPERAVLERGAVEGELFHRGAVQALAPEETQITPRLAVLTRKDLIRPDRPQLAGDDGFRFRHLLIRDAAYEALTKSMRADLHRRFAEWLADRGQELVELDEIVGYHLEQAHRYSIELGRDDRPDLAANAASRLRAAGERAAGRGDAAAAATLLRRASTLLRNGDRARREVQVELASALVDRGELREAQSILGEVVEEAKAVGDEVLEWRARVGLVAVGMWTNDVEMAAGGELVREAITVLERHGDDLGRARAWHLVGLSDFWLGRPHADEAFSRALACARGAQSGRDEAEILSWYLISAYYGPTPASEALARCDEVIEQTSSRQLEAIARIERGGLLALSGLFDEARESWEDGMTILRELRLRLAAAGSSQERFNIESLAGDLPAAEAVLREACRDLEELDEKGFLSTRAACLGLCLVRQGRHAEAEPFLEQARQLMPKGGDDVLNLIHIARAATALSEGSLDEAEDHARKALAAIVDWDMPETVGDSLVQLADVLRAAARPAEAAAAYSEALTLYERKENLVAANRVARSLASLQTGAPP